MEAPGLLLWYKMEPARRSKIQIPVFYARLILPTSFLEVSVLLMIWSLLIINEGAARYVAQIKLDGGLVRGIDKGIYGASPDLALGFLFFASLFEIFYGFMGLFIGLASIILGFRNTLVMKCCMVIQFALSVYVYVIHVLLLPIFSAIHDSWYNRDKMGGLSWFLTVLEIVISTVFCNALQGGQFMFLARLISIEEKSNFFRQSTGDRMRAVFWTICITISGICTVITGAVLYNKFGGWQTDPYFYSPNIGRLPILTMVTGIVMSLFGLTGTVHAIGHSKVPPRYFILGAFVFVLAWFNFTIAQLSFVGASAGAVAMKTGMVFAVFFLSSYFLWCASEERCARLVRYENVPS